MMTEPRNVKNFLVVVKIEQVRGPKLVIVVKMKFWGKRREARRVSNG